MLVGFAPVADRHTTILILGSMPGKESLAAGRYYAHGRNGFWSIMASVLDTDDQLSYNERLAKLLENRIGLWDVIKQCRRKTSLDSAIEEISIVVNDFPVFFAAHPNITTVCFNGAKAEQVFRKYVRATIATEKLELIRLPSTSPAYAAMRFEQKLATWRNALLRGAG